VALQLTMSRGDTMLWDTIVQQSGAPVNLAGALLWFTAKRRLSDTDAQAVLRLGSPGTGLTGITITDSPNGAITVTVPAGATDALPDFTVTLYWDLQYRSAGGRVATANSGTLLVSPDVTRATS
jgi:hypothetical protein